MDANYEDDAAGSLESPATVFWTGEQLHLSLHYWSQTEEGWDGVQLRILDGIDYTGTRWRNSDMSLEALQAELAAADIGVETFFSSMAGSSLTA